MIVNRAWHALRNKCWWKTCPIHLPEWHCSWQGATFSPAESCFFLAASRNVSSKTFSQSVHHSHVFSIFACNFSPHKKVAHTRSNQNPVVICRFFGDCRGWHPTQWEWGLQGKQELRNYTRYMGIWPMTPSRSSNMGIYSSYIGILPIPSNQAGGVEDNAGRPSPETSPTTEPRPGSGWGLGWEQGVGLGEIFAVISGVSIGVN